MKGILTAGFCGTVVAALAMSGCPASRPEAEKTPDAEASAPTARASAPSPAAAETTVPVIDAAGLKSEVASRDGKVVVVNLWATWCGPCVKEFPALAAFGKKNAGRGVELVTVSFDSPKRDDAKVAAFLAKHGQAGGAFINKEGLNPEGYPQAFEPGLAPDADFPLPRTYIVDRKGKIVKVLENEQSEASLEKAVAPYL